MRKHYIAFIMAIVMCLAALSGCSLLRSLENDVNVVFEVDGKYVDGVTVNIFNNAIAPEFDANATGAVPVGFKFMGWSAKHDWQYGDDKDLLISSGGIVRYDAVKDWVNEGGTAVAVPIIIDKATIPKSDIVIAWYSNSISGIESDDMEAFETNMRSFLTERGYDVADMDIVIRSYGGAVGTSGAAILKDDDVDILVGWGANITSTGNVPTKENVSGVTVGSKDRYAARLNNNYLSRLIFTWILNTYGGKNLEYPAPEEDIVTYKVTFNSNGGSAVTGQEVESGETVKQPVTPTRDGYTFAGWYTDNETFENAYDFTTPVTDNLILYAKWTEGEAVYDLVIAWYSKTGTSGISQENINSVEEKLTAYLATQDGYADKKVLFRAYDGNVGPSCAAIMNDGDVDIMLGWGDNITTTGGMTAGTNFIEQVGEITVGSSARNVALVKDTEISRLVYAWIQSEYGPAPVVTYKVTFNSNGGSDVDEQEVESGKTVKQPVTPTKDGYTFDGWYTDDETFENAYDFTTPVTCELTLYAKWTDGETVYDLVIAWYSKTDTSGISQENINSVEEKLTAYLAGQAGYADVKVLFRAYDGDVPTSCGDIMTAADVDIMLGWSTTSNLTDTGKMPADSILANVGSISIGTKARYAARLTDGELCELVYAWIQSEYGPAPVVTYTVTFNSNGGSDVDGQEVESGKTVQIPVTPTKDGYTFDGWYTDNETFENAYDFTTPVTGELVLYAKWKDGDPEPECEHSYPAEYEKDDTQHWQICDICHEATEKTNHVYGANGKCVCGAMPVAHDLVIGWWDNDSSGLNSDIMLAVEQGLRTYLTEIGYDLTSFNITVRAYTGNLGTTAPMIIEDGDVDVVLGYGVNLKSTGKVDYKDRVNGITMGTASDRYIYQLTDNDFTKMVYDWMKTEDAKKLLLPVEEV